MELTIDKDELELLIDGLLALYDHNGRILDDIEYDNFEWLESVRLENVRITDLLEDLMEGYHG